MQLRPHLSCALLVCAVGCSYPDFAFAPDTGADASTRADSGAEDVGGASDTSVADETPGPDAPVDALDAKPVLRTWLFDFGDSGSSTPGFNNVGPSLAAGGTLASLIDATGATTTLALRIDATDAFHTDGANSAGTTMPAGSVPFPATATRDSLYGSTKEFEGEVRPRAVVALTGLDPTLAFDLEIFASRMGGTGVLESAYTVSGVTLHLDANDNVATTVKFTKLRPTAEGNLTLTVTAGPKNTSPFGFFYVGALRLTAVLP